MNDTSLSIDVALFAQAHQLAGASSLPITWHENLDAAEVLRQLGQACEPLQSLLPSCRLAVDMQYVASDAQIASDAQLALIPPVSGG